MNIATIETQCSACNHKPLTHSFFLYSESEDHAWFYSGEHHAPHADRNVTTTIDHIKGELLYFHQRCPQKPWSWVLDCKNAVFSWFTVGLTIELITLLQNDETFSCMRVIHPNTFLEQTMAACKPFLTDYVLSKVRIESNYVSDKKEQDNNGEQNQ